MREPEYEHLFKILLIGDTAVGKSSILLRFAEDSYNERQLATIGIDFKVKFVTVNGKKLKLAIWDTAGQERFRTLTSSYYRGAQGVILVYDCTVRESFDNIRSWLEEVRKYSTNRDAIKMLVSNKIDKVGQMEVNPSEGERFAFENSMLFVQTSAKQSISVQHAFEEVVRKILETPSLISNPSGAKGQVLADDNSGDDQSTGCAC